MLSKIETSNTCMINKIVLYSYVFLIFLVLTTPVMARVESINNSCVDCHKKLSPFTDEQSRFNEIRLNHTERNISCSLECHEDVIRKRATDNFQQWSDSGHSKYYVTCDACHGGDPNMKTEAEAHAAMKNISDPNSTIYFKNIPETCGKCHTEELDNFRNTMHYQRLRSTESGPSCITCHQPHTFKVLKASELTTVCSVCHNSKDQIATATVPDDAKRALEKANEFKGEFLKAKSAIADAKSNGKDISSAQVDLDSAEAIMNNVPSLWHGFNLKNFDIQINNGIELAQKAQNKVTGVEPTVPSTPSIGTAAILSIFLIIYFIIKR